MWIHLNIKNIKFPITANVGFVISTHQIYSLVYCMYIYIGQFTALWFSQLGTQDGYVYLIFKFHSPFKFLVYWMKILPYFRSIFPFYMIKISYIGSQQFLPK